MKMENEILKTLEALASAAAESGLTELSHDARRLMEASHDRSELETLTGMRGALSGREAASQAMDDAEATVSAQPQRYALKHLYRQLEREDRTGVYRHPMDVVMSIINCVDERTATARIATELAQLDWVPRIRQFVAPYLDKDAARAMRVKLGYQEPVYAYTMYTDDMSGQIAFVEDRWFYFGPEGMDLVTPESWVRENLKLLETACKIADVSRDGVTFSINSAFRVSMRPDAPGVLFINGERSESSLEAVFASPLVQFSDRWMLPYINEAFARIGGFLNLDVCVRLSRRGDGDSRRYLFAYCGNAYEYDVCVTGNRFFEHDSARKVVDAAAADYDCDVSAHFSEQLRREDEALRAATSAPEVRLELEQVETAIRMLEEDAELLYADAELYETYLEVLEYRDRILR